MTFQPIVPLAGFAGWQFLQRTLDKQQAAFSDSAPFARATDTFRENIGAVQTAQDLVQDRALLGVALGAFGLDDDINNKAFIQKILEEGTQEGALSTRLADSRYRAFADAFGFDNAVPRTQLSTFAEDIIDRYENRQFQRAVGETNNDMRLALNLRGELADIVAAPTSSDAKWFAIMGSPPLRDVFEKALGFPSSFGRIDIDQQRDQFQDRAKATFGTEEVADFLVPENEDKLIRLFLVRSQAEAVSETSGGSIALTLLQSATLRFN